MWRRLQAGQQQQRRLLHFSVSRRQAEDIIRIENATFYRSYPSPADSGSSNPALFSGLSFSLPTGNSTATKPQFWSIWSSSSLARTTFLQVLAAQHICVPPNARTYPYLSDVSKSPQHDIQYVGFDAERGSGVGGSSVRGAYLSARYESRREATDYSLMDYLTGDTELNALEHAKTAEDIRILGEVIEQLELQKLLQMPVANLSNGQTRRARIAKALMARPEILLLDGPFMGLDPNTQAKMNQVLRGIAHAQKPRVIMSLRPEDEVPTWINHLIIADENLDILCQGPKKSVLGHIRQVKQASRLPHKTKLSRDGWPKDSPALPPGEALVAMHGVKVAYGDKVVLGGWKQELHGEQKDGLWWSLHRGQRCGIFGPNGSGKTTMLSLITSDHPQTYSLPIKLFGKSRLPGPGETGISVFDLQRRMGHSSPEVHAFFPKQLTVRRVLESAWADAPLARPNLTSEEDRMVDHFLYWFSGDLNPNDHEQTALQKVESAYRMKCTPHDAQRFRPALEAERLNDARRSYRDNISFHDDSAIAWADELRFRDLSFSSQRLLLFLRAFIAKPDLVILDEALSGVDERVRAKALLFLSHGEKMLMSDQGRPEQSILSKLEKVNFEGLSPEQALLVISHTKADVPGCVREWICLPEPGEGRQPRTGTLSGPLELTSSGWKAIWGKTS